LVELAAVVALASTIGLGWTLLVLVGTFVVGVAVAGSQITRQLARLRSDWTAEGGATGLRARLTDGALLAVAALLVAVPGLVSTAAGLLLLLPPARGAARYVSARRSKRDVIDGEVIDVTMSRGDPLRPAPPRLRSPLDWPD
ncbi:MAG: FxsA family protein, partial [Mycobacterium sp.]